METQHESKNVCRSMGGSLRYNQTYLNDMDLICDPVEERMQRRNCALQLLKAISGASRIGQKPEEESTRFAQG